VGGGVGGARIEVEAGTAEMKMVMR
jgi:hypothetical protein